jgi:hypothetical protein
VNGQVTAQWILLTKLFSTIRPMANSPSTPSEAAQAPDGWGTRRTAWRVFTVLFGSVSPLVYVLTWF